MKATVTRKMLRTRKGRKFVGKMLAAGFSLQVAR